MSGATRIRDETGYVLDSEGTFWVDGNPPQALEPGRLLGDRNGRRAGSTHAQFPASRRMSGELTRRRAPPKTHSMGIDWR
jgi:hypothetical protein